MSASERFYTVSEKFWEAEALPTLGDYVRVPCLSPDFDANWAEHGHIAKAAKLLHAWALRRPIRDLSVDLVQLPGLTPALIADVPATGGSPSAWATTLIYGHLDKQPALGDWSHGLGPFSPVRQGDRFYGRGTADDGYALFAALGAIQVLAETATPHGRCVVLIESSEESGSPHLPAYLAALSDRLAPHGPKLVVCLDSGGPTYDRLWITNSLRGSVTMTIRVEVLKEAIHSGAGGGVVPSSFRILRQLLSRLEDENTGEILVDECKVDIPAARIREAEQLAAELGARAILDFPTVPGLRLGGSGPVERILNRNWAASLAYIGVSGLPSLADAGSVIRPYTALKVMLRIPPSTDHVRAAAALERAISSNPPEGAVVTLETTSTPGFEAPDVARWLAAATDQASLAYFGCGAGAVGEGGGSPFLNDLLHKFDQAQFLVTGVLGPDSHAHGPNEMLHVPTAKRITAAMAHILSLMA